ncbi:MAG: type I DNA topoisomerase, partial [Synergistota bacterium]|nr:type I DNA topoisomerase [Synergistota bacterium]
MPSHTLVIVESPAKARTLKKILGQRYVVKASMGHVRDLPKSRMGVDVDEDFKPEYILVRGKGKIVKELREASSKADRMLIASDPDREGEAIAWHLAELLNVDSDAPCRIRMYEITAKEVKEAVKNPQAIDMDKVYAQQARRLLDRLVGYSLSPLLWSKVRSGLSAGRVQSVALRLICEREAEIEAFRPEEYWLLDVEATSDDGRSYLLRLEKKDGKALVVKSESEAEAIEKSLKGLSLVVRSFTSKEGRRSPLPPFKTSTLQQEAARRLGFSPQRTMRVAQSLYEGVDIKGRGSLGLITYMRTDSLRVAAEAIESVRGYIDAAFGDKYLPQNPHYYASKGRTQDAHEAIRPTDVALTPGSVKEDLTR